MSPRKVVILGGGIAGLASALALHKVGVSVVLLERDREEPPDTPDKAYQEWQRKPVPQFRHSHIFLARLRNILLAEAPELLQAIVGSGAVELHPLEFASSDVRAFGSMPGDDALVSIGSRRSTFEWVLQAHVSQLPGVELLRGQVVEGLESVEVDGMAHIRAVRTSKGSLDVDGVLVDSMGRVSPVRRWLAHANPPRVEPPVESRLAISYLTLAYETLNPSQPPSPGWRDMGWARCSVFPGESGHLTVTLVLPDGDDRLRELRLVSRFDELVRRVPDIGEQLDSSSAVPLGGAAVQVMTGVRSRSLNGSTAQMAANLVHVGDSAYAPNPVYGQGVTMAFMQAFLLAGCIRATGDVASASSSYRGLSKQSVEPFFRFAVRSDQGFRFDTEAGSSNGIRSRVSRLIRESAKRDPHIFRAYMRGFHMIELPIRAVVRPKVIARALLGSVSPRFALGRQESARDET